MASGLQCDGQFNGRRGGYRGLGDDRQSERSGVSGLEIEAGCRRCAAGEAAASRDGCVRDGKGSGSSAALAGFAEKSFFEYHLYTLGRTTSLANNSTKQIELFAPKLDVPIKKTYVYYGVPEQLRFWSSDSPNMDQNLGTDSNKKVDVYLILTNSEKNGLGIPLPAGRIRVYKRDPEDNANEFIGEDVMQHTPKDEDVMVKLG